MIIFTQVLHLTQCSPKHNCVSIQFHHANYVEQTQANAICCAIMDFGKPTPTYDYDLSSPIASVFINIHKTRVNICEFI